MRSPLLASAFSAAPSSLHWLSRGHLASKKARSLAVRLPQVKGFLETLGPAPSRV